MARSEVILCLLITVSFCQFIGAKEAICVFSNGTYTSCEPLKGDCQTGRYCDPPSDNTVDSEEYVSATNEALYFSASISSEIVNPKWFPENNTFKALTMTGNNFPELKSEDFEHLEHVRFMILSNNSIAKMEAELFESLVSLELLDLSDNHLTALENLGKLGMLEKLCLEDNKIESLNANAFESYPQLHELVLDNNEISALESGVFSSLENLWKVSIKSNNISELSSFGNGKVKILDLTKNAIVAIRNSTFEQCHGITDLNLSFNLIEVIEPCAFCELSNISALRLEGNRIAVLPHDVFTHMTRLQQIFLQGNLIAEITRGVFPASPVLTNIDLSNNRIVKIHGYAFANLNLSLNTLFLNTNRLAYLHDKTFAGLSSLRRISLQNNQLNFLSKEVISNLNGLGVVQVELGGNPWFCSCRDEIQKNLQKAYDHGDKHINCDVTFNDSDECDMTRPSSWVELESDSVL